MTKFSCILKHFCLLISSDTGKDKAHNNVYWLWLKYGEKPLIVKSGWAILIDLSKAFDCLSHELLIAKLDAYGFDKSVLKFIYDYLKSRIQRTRVTDYYSSWKELKYGVPQGSILGPLLFNIFINDVFSFLDKAIMPNYADDNSTYATDLLKY